MEFNVHAVANRDRAAQQPAAAGPHAIFFLLEPSPVHSAFRKILRSYIGISPSLEWKLHPTRGSTTDGAGTPKCAAPRRRGRPPPPPPRPLLYLLRLRLAATPLAFAPLPPLTPLRRRRGPVVAPAAASLRFLAPSASHLCVRRRGAPCPRGGWRGLHLAASRPSGVVADAPPVRLTISRSYSLRVGKGTKKAHFDDDHNHRAVNTALWCNFLVFSLKFGVWIATSSHVMLAEMVHSVADFANQALLAYGLRSSRRAPDAIHPYGYSKERFVWSLISAVGIFCLGSGATIVHGVQNLWNSQPPENIHYAALVISGSFLIEGASLLVAIKAVKKGAEAEGMSIRDYIWRGHDPTSVAVMTEDGAAVTGLVIAGASLVAVQMTGNAMYDPVGSIIVGNLLGMVAIFLIQRNRHALIGRAIDDHDMQRVLEFLKSDTVVDALYDCKSEVIGPGFFRFKAEIDFNGVVLVQNYLERTGRETWAKQFRKAAMSKDDSQLLMVMANYGEDVVDALGYEVDRLESEIKKIVPGIKHVDIEAHNPEGLTLMSKGFVDYQRIVD